MRQHAVKNDRTLSYYKLVFITIIVILRLATVIKLRATKAQIYISVNIIAMYTRFFYKKVVCKKVVLDWQKPKESFSTSSKKFKTIFKLNQTVFTCMVSRDMRLKMLKSFQHSCQLFKVNMREVSSFRSYFLIL